MPEFREEEHPRDPAGKFIESGGEKLKAWGKAAIGKYSVTGSEKSIGGGWDPGRLPDPLFRHADPSAMKRHREEYPRTKVPQPKGGTSKLARPKRPATHGSIRASRRRREEDQSAHDASSRESRDGE